MDNIVESSGRTEKEKMLINVLLKNLGGANHFVPENQEVLDVIRETQNGITYQLFEEDSVSSNQLESVFPRKILYHRIS
jgi:hypothetical protein